VPAPPQERCPGARDAVAGATPATVHPRAARVLHQDRTRRGVVGGGCSEAPGGFDPARASRRRRALTAFVRRSVPRAGWPRRSRGRPTAAPASDGLRRCAPGPAPSGGARTERRGLSPRVPFVRDAGAQARSRPASGRSPASIFSATGRQGPGSIRTGKHSQAGRPPDRARRLRAPTCHGRALPRGVTPDRAPPRRSGASTRPAHARPEAWGPWPTGAPPRRGVVRRAGRPRAPRSPTGEALVRRGPPPRGGWAGAPPGRALGPLRPSGACVLAPRAVTSADPRHWPPSATPHPRTGHGPCPPAPPPHGPVAGQGPRERTARGPAPTPAAPVPLARTARGPPPPSPRAPRGRGSGPAPAHRSGVEDSSRHAPAQRRGPFPCGRDGPRAPPLCPHGAARPAGVRAVRFR
jgi:hypothetical protein